MEFEADPIKAAQNFKKHKVSFEEAASIFGDSMELTFPDPDHSVGEMRWLSFGMSGRGRVLAVIYTERRGKVRRSAREWLRNMKGKSMKKTDEMRAEYRREDLGKGVRGKHYAAFQKGSNLVLLTPELAKIFPTNEAVNSALASLVGIARSAVTKPKRVAGGR